MKIYLKTKEGTKHSAKFVLRTENYHYPYFMIKINISREFEEIPVQKKYEIVVEEIEDNPHGFPITQEMIERWNQIINQGEGSFLSVEYYGGWRKITSSVERILETGLKILLSENDYIAFDEKYEEWLKTNYPEKYKEFKAK